MTRSTVWTGDWAALPGTLHLSHIAAIFGIHPKTAQVWVRAGDWRLPRPAFLSPRRWRKADVRRYYESQSIETQRKAQRLAVSA